MSDMDTEYCTLCCKDLVDGTYEDCHNCGSHLYCSRECSEADWPFHQMLCDPTESYLTSNVEGPSVRGIMFPQNGEKPHFVWIKLDTTLAPKEDQLRRHLTELISSDAQKLSAIHHEALCHNNVRNVSLYDKDLYMVTRADDEEEDDNMSIDTVVQQYLKYGVPNNALGAWSKVVEKKMKKNGPFKWGAKTYRDGEELAIEVDNWEWSERQNTLKEHYPKGNVIFVTLTKNANAKDLEYRDFRHIVDYLSFLCEPEAAHPMFLQFYPRLVKGVSINCNGDMQDRRLDRCTVVHFPQDHLIFQQEDGDAYAVPQVIGGLPLFKVRRVELTDRGEGKRFKKNPDFEIMALHLEPGYTFWGQVHPGYLPHGGAIEGEDGSPGSMYVVRADREDLELKDLTMVIDFMKLNYRQQAIRGINGQTDKFGAIELLRDLRAEFQEYRQEMSPDEISEFDETDSDTSSEDEEMEEYEDDEQDYSGDDQENMDLDIVSENEEEEEEGDKDTEEESSCDESPRQAHRKTVGGKSIVNLHANGFILEDEEEEEEEEEEEDNMDIEEEELDVADSPRDVQDNIGGGKTISILQANGFRF